MKSASHKKSKAQTPTKAKTQTQTPKKQATKQKVAAASQTQQPAVTPAVTSVAPTSVGAGPNVTFRIGADGKVRYHALENDKDRKKYKGHYIAMTPEKFAVLKNAGKRWDSEKVTDVASMKNYTKATAPANVPLVDRTRTDRTGEPLATFDNSPHAEPITINNRRHDKAKVAGSYDRDHRPSNAAQNDEYGARTGRKGWTVAMPHTEMHIPLTTTYGGNQDTLDTDVNGQRAERKKLDAKHLSRAFYKDTFYVLDASKGEDYSTVQSRDKKSTTQVPELNLKNDVNRIRQIGADRTAFRKNVQMFAESKGKPRRRGIDPNAPGHLYSYSGPAKTNDGKPKIGSFTYTKDPANRTQGQIIADAFRQRLVDEGHAKLVG